MEVILVKDLKNKGKLGDRIQVKLGYARNFLFPNGLALPITPQNLQQYASLRNKELKKRAEEKGGFEIIAKSLSGKIITIKSKTHKGSLYGSVTPAASKESCSYPKATT